MERYNRYNFISPCCKSFNFYNGNNIYCSKCGKLIRTLKDDESLTIDVKFNINYDNNSSTSISGDLIDNFNKNTKRFAKDVTCEDIIHKCDKCDNEICKYVRNPRDEIVYICTKCRNVMTD